jgi:hypothetical protein
MSDPLAVANNPFNPFSDICHSWSGRCVSQGDSYYYQGPVPPETIPNPRTKKVRNDLAPVWGYPSGDAPEMRFVVSATAAGSSLTCETKPTECTLSVSEALTAAMAWNHSGTPPGPAFPAGYKWPP